MFGAGGWWSGGQVVAAGRSAVRWGGGSVGVVARLFFQCILAWRSLQWARGSGC
jgi:hypothetical protein